MSSFSAERWIEPTSYQAPSWVLGPVQGLRREGEKGKEKTCCLGGPDGRNETQIAIIYFRRPVITEPESV